MTGLRSLAAFGAVAALAGCAGLNTEAPPEASADYGPIYVLDASFPETRDFTFRNVSWVTLTPDEDELYMLQRGAPAVSVWTPDGVLKRTWTTDALGDPHSLRFETLADGNLRIWITDMAPPRPAGSGFGHCIKAFDEEGTYLGAVGQCGKNTEGTSLDPIQFDRVTDTGFTPGGTQLVTDGDINGLNNRVVTLDAARTAASRSWSGPGGAPGDEPKAFNLPHAMDVDSCGRVFVADALNHRIQVIDEDGRFLQQLQCFNTEGVYGLRVRTDPVSGAMRLFASSSPTSDAKGGRMWIFSVDAACSAAPPVPVGCTPDFAWPVSLPEGSSARSLHAIDATADGSAVYIAPLGGDLAPQRWMRVWPVDGE